MRVPAVAVQSELPRPVRIQQSVIHGAGLRHTLLFTVIVAFLQLNLTKERSELKHKINSLVDPLSGVANRRAFLDSASSLLGRYEPGHEPFAMLLFDLDHFKQINDRLGHSAGDAVLQVFAGTATSTLGADVLFARIGGEEFAACMPVGDMDEAYAIAERVRRNFAATAARFGNGQLSPSVSAGVALGRETEHDGRRLAVDRRSGAVSSQGAGPQPRRGGNGGLRHVRYGIRRAVDCSDYWNRPLGIAARIKAAGRWRKAL